MHLRNLLLTFALAALLIGLGGRHAVAQTLEERLRLLEESYTELLIRDREKSQEIERLRGQVKALQSGSRDDDVSADDGHGHGHGEKGHAAKGHGKKKGHGHDAHKDGGAETAHAHGHEEDSHGHGGTPDLYSVDVGPGRARFSGVFLDTSFAAGGSSEQGEVLEQLQGGDHDPRQNGFTLRTVDLSLAGGFDPYFDAFATMAFFIDAEGETRLELEEAFVQTQSAFSPVEIRAGQFFTEFGLSNPTHIHDEDFVDAPFALTRFFGPDGLRGQGVRVAWRTEGDTPFEILGGVQNSQGETQASFRASDELIEEQPVGGLEFVESDVDGPEDLTYFLRASKVFGLGGEDRGLLGGSAAFGPNSSGPDGYTVIGGLHAAARIGLAGGDSVRLQAEGLYRHFDVDPNNPTAGFVGQDFEDWAMYGQAIYEAESGLHAGLRAEFGSGDGESVGAFANRDEDPFRSDRVRISPMVGWTIVPGLRAFAQYNYDNADFLDGDDAHSLWFGLNWSFGAGRRLELNALNEAIGGHHH